MINSEQELGPGPSAHRALKALDLSTGILARALGTGILARDEDASIGFPGNRKICLTS